MGKRKDPSNFGGEEAETPAEIKERERKLRQINQKCTSNKKAKTKDSKDDDIVILKESLLAVANAILKSTMEVVKSQPNLPTPKSIELLNRLRLLLNYSSLWCCLFFAGLQRTSNKKAKTKDSKDDDIVILKESLLAVANAILKSIMEVVKSQPKLPTPKSEIWNMLVDLGFDGLERMKAYIFLGKNPDMLDVILGCPAGKRKSLIEMMSLN